MLLGTGPDLSGFATYRDLTRKFLGGCLRQLVLGGAPERQQHFFLRDSRALQQSDALARLFCQDGRQEMQGFYLAVFKAALKSLR